MALVFTVTSNIGINLFCTQDIMLIGIGKIWELDSTDDLRQNDRRVWLHKINLQRYIYTKWAFFQTLIHELVKK